MAQNFRSAWAAIKQQRKSEQQRTYSASSFVPPTKSTSPTSHRRKPVSNIDHLIDQLRNPQLESELADAAWYKARAEIYAKDPKNFKYNTRLG